MRRAGTEFAFRGIDELPIGVTSTAVIAAFKPFMCGDVSPAEWARLIGKLRQATFKRVRKKVLGGAGRSKAVIAEEYDEAWSRGFGAYDLSRGCRKPEPWRFRGQPLIADRAGIPRMRSTMLASVLRALAPIRVLEVGCGNGINLLLLAGAFPDIRFTGLELTEAGNRVARQLQTEPELPATLTTYATVPQVDRGAFKRIEFLKGDAARMPFTDNSFDLVITVLAVEQMERVRDTALAEIARVSGGRVLMLEPFTDANRSLWRRLHIYARDYFRGSIGQLPRYGLRPEWATMDYPQELQLGSALVLSRKVP